MFNGTREQLGVTTIGIKMKQLHERYTSGKIGEKFAAFFESDEIADYYNKNLVQSVLQEYQKITNFNIKKIFETIIVGENLWFNFEMNFIRYTFNKAVDEWVTNGGDLEDIIIRMISFDEVKQVIYILQVALAKMANSPLDAFEVVEDDSDEDFGSYIMQDDGSNGGNETASYEELFGKDALKDVPSVRMMKNNGKNKLN